MKKLIVVLFISLLCPVLSFGQANTVSLVASGDGDSKTEAESLALRSAIEQAFGTFVSANTTILNDEIVKDEIATISSGNIERYSIVAESKTAGRWYVTVKAVVSINKLVDYAKSHGSSTEFAGQNFAMQMKMRKLNKENEEKALYDLFAGIEKVSSTISLFDYRIRTGTPEFISDSKFKVPVIVSANWNQNGRNVIDIVRNTFNALSLSSSEQASYKSNSYPMVSCKPLIAITGGDTEFVLRTGLARDVINEIKMCFLKNLHCFEIIRKGDGEENKSWVWKIENPYTTSNQEHLTREVQLEREWGLILPEKILYETTGFEIVPDPSLSIYNPEMVDLGLSVKWANKNMGECSIHPFADYYAWGEIYSNKTYYSREDSRWDGKYYSRTNLEPCDDAAHVKLGGKWRMPTDAEWTELRENCTWTWTKLGGVKGYKVTSKKSGLTDKFIFLPVTAYRDNMHLEDYGCGEYWSSTKKPNSDAASGISFDSDIIKQYYRETKVGRVIRPVSE